MLTKAKHEAWAEAEDLFDEDDPTSLSVFQKGLREYRDAFIEMIKVKGHMNNWVEPFSIVLVSDGGFCHL